MEMKEVGKWWQHERVDSHVTGTSATRHSPNYICWVHLTSSINLSSPLPKDQCYTLTSLYLWFIL